MMFIRNEARSVLDVSWSVFASVVLLTTHACVYVSYSSQATKGNNTSEKHRCSIALVCSS